MDASTILMMIEGEQLKQSSELAAFLAADTDCYLLLMGLQTLSYHVSDYTEVVAGYAAINKPEELAHFIDDLTDLTALNTLEEVSGRDTAVGHSMEHVYTPMVEKVFLEKGRAFIQHNGLVACDQPLEMFGVLNEQMQALGFYDCFKPHQYYSLEVFEEFYRKLLDTTYFVFNKDNSSGHYCLRDDKNIIAFDFRVPVSHFYKLFQKESKEWRMRIQRDFTVKISLEGTYDTHKRVIILTEEATLHAKSGTRTTCIEHVRPRYERAFIAAALQLIHANVPKVDSIKPKCFRITPSHKDFMARVLEEGAELIAKAKANASDSPKPAINAADETEMLTTSFAQKQPARGMCPECGQEKTCEMDEIEHDLYACGHCGLEVPKSVVLNDWEFDMSTRTWHLKEVKP